MDTLNTQDTSAETLLQLVQAVFEELHPQRKASVAVSLDSDLDRELGFDSLGRVELLHRIQHTFDVALPEQLFASAETPRDLLIAVMNAEKSRRPFFIPAKSEAPEKIESAPDNTLTLLETLAWHVQAHPGRVHILLQDESGQEESISYASLQQGALAIAAGLLERNLQPGQAVAIMLPTCREYFYSFFGILMAGGVPVPIYPPARLSQIEDHLRRHAGILSNAQASILITVHEAKPIAKLLGSQEKHYALS